MIKDKWLKRVVYILLGLLVILFIIKASPKLLQNDILYDLKLGERYLTKGMFHIDDYSFHAGLIYQTHHYLVSILLYLVYHLFSFNGLYYLEILLYALIALLLYLNNKLMIKNKIIIYLFLIFQLIALSSFTSLRAWMFSNLIFLLEFICLEKYLDTNKKRYVFILSFLPLLLINVHSGVIYFYFIIILTYILNVVDIKVWKITNDKRVKDKAKILCLVILIGLLVSLINPYGINGLTYAFKTLNSYYINNYITEFQAPNFLSPFGFLVIIYLLICLLSLIFSKRSIYIHELLLFGGTSFMALTSTRHFALLVICSIVLLPHVESLYKHFDKKEWNLIESLKKGLVPMNIMLGSFYVIIIIFISAYHKGNNTFLPSNIYPVKATSYIKKHLPKSVHIYNKYEWGSYLMFNDILQFIDSRCDLYTSSYNPKTDVFKDYIYLVEHPSKYQLIINKYKIDYFLIDTNSHLAKHIIKDNKGNIIYQDETSILIEVIK